MTMDTYQIPIIFESQDFLIVDKPPLWLSVYGRFQNDPRPCLAEQIQKQLKIQIWPTHRLDYEVSGIMLFAKNSSAHQKANFWFESKLIQKTYEALTESNKSPPPLHQIQNWHSQILRGKKRAYESPHGKKSHTQALFMGPTENEGVLEWTLYPLTGRSHQLRFDLSRHGFPIYGDVLYGAQPQKINGIALRATQLNFEKVSHFQLPKEIKADNLRTFLKQKM